MFDNVGRNLDEEATKRSFASVLIASLILGAAGAFVVGWGAMKVVETVQQTTICDDGLVVQLIEDETRFEAPAAPPPPPPPAAAAAVEPTSEDRTVEPDELVDDVVELEPVPKVVEVKSQPRPAGQIDGQDGGKEGGVTGGTQDGTPDGKLGGELGPLTYFAQDQLDLKVQRMPIYPPEAAGLHPSTVVCRAEVGIDASGSPFTVVVTGCPTIFHASTKAALLKWRWYPPRVNKQKSPAKTKIAVQFVPPS